MISITTQCLFLWIKQILYSALYHCYYLTSTCVNRWVWYNGGESSEHCDWRKHIRAGKRRLNENILIRLTTRAAYNHNADKHRNKMQIAQLAMEMVERTRLWSVGWPSLKIISLINLIYFQNCRVLAGLDRICWLAIRIHPHWSPFMLDL